MIVVKSMVIQSVRDRIVGEMNIVMDGQVLEEVEGFMYLCALVIVVACPKFSATKATPRYVRTERGMAALC